LSGEPVEVFRAITGGRTAEQVRGLAWRAALDDYESVFSDFGWPENGLDE
jgi:hypothetical protein